MTMITSAVDSISRPNCQVVPRTARRFRRNSLKAFWSATYRWLKPIHQVTDFSVAFKGTSHSVKKIQTRNCKIRKVRPVRRKGRTDRRLWLLIRKLAQRLWRLRGQSVVHSRRKASMVDQIHNGWLKDLYRQLNCITRPTYTEAKA
jgi:hypothetical protein